MALDWVKEYETAWASLAEERKLTQERERVELRAKLLSRYDMIRRELDELDEEDESENILKDLINNV